LLVVKILANDLRNIVQKNIKTVFRLKSTIGFFFIRMMVWIIRKPGVLRFT